MEKASLLIQELAGGKISNYFYDLNEGSKQKYSISISLNDISSRLGYPVGAGSFEKRMKEIPCKFKLEEKKSLSASSSDVSSSSASPSKISLSNASSAVIYKVTPPSHRSDLKIKEDLIEEFARLEGYDKIPENSPSVFFQTAESDKTFLNFQKWIQYLSSRSWLQSIHYSFCDPDYYKDFLNSKFYLEDLMGEAPLVSSSKQSSSHKGKTTFKINNPISQKLSLMKPLLTPDLFKTLVQNFRKNNKQGQIFELSPVFYSQGDSYEQNWHLAMALWGEVLDIWQNKSIPNFYKMKSELEALFQVAGLKIKTSVLEPSSHLPFLHPKKSLLLSCQNRKIGFIGVLHPTLAEKHKIPVEVALAEIDLSFLNNKKEKPVSFKAFSNLLTVEKDLCFIIPESLSVQKAKEEITKTLGAVCQEVLIFDIYKKEDQRFVSFRLRLSPDKKSWTDEELQSFLQKVIQRLDKKLSIKLKP